MLGVEIQEFKDSIRLSQRKNIDGKSSKILEGVLAPVNSPILPGVLLLIEDDGELVDVTWYHGAICTFLYVSFFTHPDVSFSVNYHSRLIERPLKSHMKSVIKVMRYLATTKDYCLDF
jgi:hypothetical protein